MAKQQFLAALTLLALFAPCAEASETRARHNAPGLDGVFLNLADELPGFGGYFFDENGDLNVYLTDLGQEPAARARLTEVAQNRPERWRQPWTRPAAIIIRRAQFDFVQLDAVRSRLATAVGAWDGVNMFDTNEATNRVIVGVRNEETRQRVLAQAATLDLPRNAYTIDVMPDAAYVSTVQDAAPTMIGGLRIEFTTIDGLTHACTLGANVTYTNTPQGISAVPGFLTASHCSQTQAATDQTQYRQGTNTNPVNVIGAETYDPPTFNWRTTTDCPYQDDSIVCRWSDVSFVAYSGGVSRSQGYFAKTLWPGVGINQPGSRDLDTSQFVADSTIYPATGWTMEKVGQETGWTEGTVQNTCTDVPLFNVALQKTFYTRCATEVWAYAFDGDSGAPVFHISNGNTVAFSGIVFAKTGRGGYYYSSVQEIQRDFGTELNWWNYTP